MAHHSSFFWDPLCNQVFYTFQGKTALSKVNLLPVAVPVDMPYSVHLGTSGRVGLCEFHLYSDLVRVIPPAARITDLAQRVHNHPYCPECRRLPYADSSLWLSNVSSGIWVGFRKLHLGGSNSFIEDMVVNYWLRSFLVLSALARICTCVRARTHTSAHTHTHACTHLGNVKLGSF